MQLTPGTLTARYRPRHCPLQTGASPAIVGFAWHDRRRLSNGVTAAGPLAAATSPLPETGR